ncbi:MAG: flippase [Armatimonadetes bacterium]|nr:flippase [Armatimonadota bacterium]
MVTRPSGGGTARSMLRNTAAMAGSHLITWVASFALIVHLPRGLGAAAFGRLNFIGAITGMMAIFIDFGTSILVTREVARNRGRAAAYLTNVMALKVVTALIGSVALVGVMALAHQPPQVVHLAAILGLGMVIGTAGRLVDSILQAHEEVHKPALGLTIDKVVGAAVIVLLLRQGFGIIAVAWAGVIVAALGLVRNAWWMLRLTRPNVRLLSLGFMRRAMAASMPFFLFAVFAKVYDKVDITMLGMMTTDEVVGWYGAAYRLFQTLFFVSYILQTVSFPVLSRLWSEKPEAYRRAAHRGFALLAVAAVGVCVCTAALANPVVDALYTREKFPGTAAALQILAAALFFQYLNTMVAMVLQTSDLQMRWTRAAALAAVFNPAVNYLLIPRYGHLGAAITTVATEALVMLLALRACPPGIFDRRDALTVARALGAGAILACGLWLGLRWGLVPALLIGLPLYAAATIRLGALSREEIALMVGAARSIVPRSGRATAEEPSDGA